MCLYTIHIYTLYILSILHSIVYIIQSTACCVCSRLYPLCSSGRQVPLLFSDVCALASDMAVCEDGGNLYSAAVPGCDLFVCGFSCTSVSGLNPAGRGNRAEGLDLAARRTSSSSSSASAAATSSTWLGQLGYVKAARPKLVINENVKMLAASPRRPVVAVVVVFVSSAAAGFCQQLAACSVQNHSGHSSTAHRALPYSTAVHRDRTPCTVHPLLYPPGMRRTSNTSHKINSHIMSHAYYHHRMTRIRIYGTVARYII